MALAVGMAAGAYSSIFIATPFLAQLKERQPAMRSLTARVTARRAQGGKGRAGGVDSEGAKVTSLSPPALMKLCATNPNGLVGPVGLSPRQQEISR